MPLTLRLAMLLGLGFAAQWLAWRLRTPAIVFLLLIGIVLGPVTGWLDPEVTFGPLLSPFIALGVAVILFEGSMTLKREELRGVGPTVVRLVTIGALVTLAVIACAAHFLAGLGWPIATLFATIVCVTGPTVIVPMLRSVRPRPALARVLRWEGVVIDPLGALLAVLVYEAVALHEEGQSLRVFMATVGSGVGCGLAGTVFLALALRRQWLPEYLQAFGALAAVVLVFAGSNELASESGLLAVTVMGMSLANTPGLVMEEILNFKEHLSTLIISLLFMILAAKLPWPLPARALPLGLIVFLVAQFVARPLAVTVSTLGSPLTVRERVLLGWIAPRGIVAAAVSSLFALRLEHANVEGADLLVPLTFIMIIGTVLFQSATAAPLARWLNVAEPEPTGFLIVGANSVAQTLALALRDNAAPVLLVDTDWAAIAQARMRGLDTWYGDALSAHAEWNLDLAGLGSLLAFSPQRELNSLACVRYRPEFGRHNTLRVRVLPVDSASQVRREHANALRVPILFGGTVTYSQLAEKIADGWTVKSTRLSETFDLPAFRAEHGDDAIILFVRAGDGRISLITDKQPDSILPGTTVSALVAPKSASSLPQPR